MLEENKVEVTETKPVTEVKETAEVKDDVKVEEKDNRSIFTRAYDKLFPAKKEVAADTADDDDDPDEPVVETTEVKDGELEIEDELYQAAKAKGWSDEKIAKYYQEDKTVLEALLPAKVESTVDETSTVDDKSKGEVKGLEKISIDAESMTALKEQYGDEVIDKVVTPLMEKLNQTIDIVNNQSVQSKQVEAEISKQAMAQQVKGFQKEMDKLGEKYEVFGKWENVPLKDGKVDVTNPVLKVRDEVWKMARKFQQLGSDWTTAVDDAVSLYKGKNLESLTHSQIIKDLGKRKIKFTPRPTSKKVETAPPSGDARKIAVINLGLKAIGKEI